MKSLETMSKDERSLLLYLECRSVDYGGRVDALHMNAEDLTIAKKWNEEGFIEFGRIVYRNITNAGTQFVKFSEEAWKLAHEERRARFNRMWLKRDWISTKESMEINGDPHLSGMNS